MKKLYCGAFVVTILTVNLAGCAMSGSKESECKEYEQAKTEATSTVDLAKKLQLTGKITANEMIKIDQDAALYSKRLHDLCNFLRDDKINYTQYNQGVTQAAEDYQKLKELVVQKSAGK